MRREGGREGGGQYLWVIANAKSDVSQVHAQLVGAPSQRLALHESGVRVRAVGQRPEP